MNLKKVTTYTTKNTLLDIEDIMMNKLLQPKKYPILFVFLLSFLSFSTQAQFTITQGGTPVGATDIVGTTPVGVAITRVYTVTNTSGSTESLTNIDIVSGVDFSIIGALPTFPHSMAPGDMITFTVQFLPTDENIPLLRTGLMNVNGIDVDLFATVETFAPEIVVQAPAPTNNVNDGATTHDFGGVSVGSPIDVVFTIRNIGNVDLTLTSAIVIGGTNAGLFTVIIPPGLTTIPAAGNTTFTVRYVPDAVANHQATITIPNDDISETNFTFDITGEGLQPEIEIEQGGTAIADGGTYDFGNVVRPGNSNAIFDVSNTNIGDLIFTGTPDLITISGTNAADFTVITNPSTVAGGGSTTFQIRFTPSDYGTRTATLTIPNNDLNEDPYVINLTGVGQSPEIEITHFTGSPIYASGTSTGVEVGQLQNRLVGQIGTPAFRLYNLGNITLNLSSLTISGADGAELTTNPGLPLPATLAPGTWVHVGFIFTPLTPGSKTMTLTFDSDDLDESTYVLNLVASAITPEIDVTKGATPVPGNGSYTEDYGSILFGQSSTDLEFTVENTASGAYAGQLQFDNNPRVTIGGANPGDFTLTDITGNIDPGNSRTFRIQFTPTALGTRTATVTIDNNDMDEGSYTFNLTGVGAAPEMQVAQGGTNINDGGTYNFPASITVGNTSALIAFTIENQTSATPFDLELLNSPNFVTFSGGNAGDFNVVIQPPSSTITNGNSTTFNIQFAPTNFGARTTDMVIQTNDPDHPTYTITLNGQGVAPEMDIFEGATPYADGATYDFGDQLFTTPASGAGAVTFTIQNNGDQILNLNNGGAGNIVKITGVNPGDFVLTDVVSSSIGISGATTTFTLDFQPTGTGVRSANLEIANDDGDEDPYNLVLTGTGVTPQMEVSQAAINIANAGTYNFGDALQGGGSAKTFTIENTGTGVLTIDVASIVITGTDASMFTVTTPPPASIAAGASATFVVTFSPTSTGAKQAQISIPNSDLDDDPFTFTMDGTGLTPGVEIAFGGSGIPNGGSQNIGSVLLTQNSGNLIFDINNTGGGSLILTAGPPRVAISGPDAAFFSLFTDAPASVPGGSTGSFIIRFTPDPALATGERTYNAVLTVLNSDLTDGTYIVNISGEGVTPDMTIEQGATTLADGSGNYDFGDVQRFSSFGVRDNSGNIGFTARNTGSGILTFSGTPKVQIGGTNPGDFSLISDISGDISASDFRNFLIEFEPDDVGIRTATVTINNSDLDEDPYSFTITGTGRSPQLEISEGGTGISDGGSYDFGDILRTTSSSTTTFDLDNVNWAFQDDLFLSGTPIVTITGADAADFSLIADASTSTLSPGNGTTFQIQFTPSFSGLHTATVEVKSNDHDNSTYSFTIQGTGITPEMLVKQGGTTLGNGSSTHNFGAVNVASTTDVTFTIENVGTSPLNLGSLTITGTNAAEFTVQTAPVSPVAASSSTTLVIRFAPTATGVRTATVTIDNDDLGDDPYVFDLLGTGITAGIAIEQGGTGIANTDIYNFGNILQSQNSGDITFDINNTGTSTLDIFGTPRVVITGTHASDFTVVTDAPSSVAASGSSTFQIRFTPSALGTRTAKATITNSDLTNGTFDIFLQGTSITPDVNVAQGGTSYADGSGVFSFGNILDGENSGDITFDLENSGDGILTISGGTKIQISGPDAGAFTLISDAPGSIAASSSATFQIRFTPAFVGAHTALVTIDNSDLDEDPYTFTLQGAGVESEMDLEQGGTAIVDGGSYDFGQVLATTTGTAITFDIDNTGLGILRLTTPGDNVVISGPNAADFTLVTDAPDNIAAGATGNFQITFNPASVGIKTATVTINNNDPDEGAYSFAITGLGVRSEIGIEQGGTDIPITVGSYNFGSVLNGESSSDITFTISNTQNGNLNLTGVPNRVQISGAAAGDFVLVTDAPATIPFFNSDTFVLRFTPTTTGIRSATITIANNDFDENPYTFNILGTGVVSEMDVSQGATPINDGDTYDFGNILRTNNSGDIPFTIANSGTGTLKLTGAPDRVTISGANASDFSVETDAPATVNASETFELRFTPSATGLRTATVSIANNDSDENPYTFIIEGTGITPEIDIDQGGTAIANGGTHNFGGFVLGGNSGDITFTLENNGSSTLNLSGSPRVVISGPNAADFTLEADAGSATVATASSTTFQIRFTPSATGLRTAIATITSDDLDEGSYVINLNGSGSTPGIDVGQGATVIANSGSYDFGNVIQGNNSGNIGFFIENTGGSTLTLSTTPRIAITGADASDFTLVTDAPTTVLAGATVNFTLLLTPSSIGTKNAIITIAHDGLTDNPYIINLTGTSISPEINVAQGGTNIANAGSYDFGSILQTQSSGDVTFDIENLGTSTLNISGATKVSITGANASDFNLITDAAGTIATSGTTNFVIRFSPTGTGARTATVTITSDDLDESPYTITLNGTGITPEMDIDQAGTAIADGSGSHDFGNVLQGESSSDITFTINNTGTGILDLSGATRVNISGAAAGDYTLVSDAPSSIAASGSAPFQIRFSPSTTGARNATVTINNSDLDEDPYTFDLTGNGVVSEIQVAQGATPLLDGAGNYNFGSVLQGENSSDITFTINNSGSGDLKFTGTPIVNISGINAADFTVVTDATSPIAAGTNGTFILRFSPSGTGLRQATITLTNNDLDEGTYTFDVQGTGIVSEIAIAQGASPIPNTTGSHNFGSVLQGQSSSDINFTIENTGTGELKISGATKVNIGGANPGDFILVTDAPATIASGGNANFTIRFTPTTTGVRLATVTINNNDLDEGTYTFNLSGNGITPEINVNQGGTDLLSDIDTYNFGNIIQGESSSNIIFTIQNTTGTGTLSLTSTPRVIIGGLNPGDFTLVTDAPTSVGAGGSATFAIRFTPSASGLREATVTIANTDLDEGSYTFTLNGTGTTPEINIRQGVTNLISGVDIYDFGNVLRSTTSSTVNFTIENLGSGALNLDGIPNRISIGGTNPGDFSLVMDAPASIASAGSGIFQLSFTPTASGSRTATVSISNNDLDEDPYTFDITGTGITPEIDVDQGGTAIANGGTHNFGGFIIGNNSGDVLFTITNNGTSPLNLSGTPRIVIGGAHPGDFTLVTDASAGPIVNAGTTTFEIRFAPTATGLRTATATITSDDLDESPYIINLNGNGSTPGIDIGQGGAVIANSGSYDFGTIIQSQNSGDIVFFIENTGTSTLNLTSTPRVIVGGANAGDFSVTTDAPTSVGAGGTVNFEVRFTPTALGVRNATITVANSDLTDNPYVINLTGTSVSPEIGVKQGLTPIASGGTYDFGTVLQSQNGGDIIFGVENTGTSTLNLSGATRVVITGTNAGDFQLITDAPSSVGIAATGNFAIRFAPTGTGARTAVATITSDDLDEGTYTVNLSGNGITPEMDVEQAGTAIADAVDSYDFGNVLQGENSSDIVFTIRNTGTGILDLTGATRINISGAAAGDYTLVSDAPTTVTAGSSVTFTLRFSPSTTGARNATVTINNSDLDENPYTFDLLGNGVVSEIEVVQGATPLLDGAGSYDFGNVLQGQSSGDISFDINNTGSGDLVLSGATRVDISGTNAGDFILVTDASTPIGPSSSGSFVIRFTPLGGGARTATVTLTTNDLDEGTYTFDLFGTGITPEIAVTQGATPLPTPAGTHNFGNVLQGQSSSDINFTITNSGTGDLLITGANNVNIGGTNPGDFVLVTDAASTVASGGGTSNFTIRFTPTTTGLRFATVTINNNDLDEGTYIFNLTGNSITPEINVVQGGTNLLNGTGVHNFGSVLQGQNSANVTFTIENTAGTGPLDLTSTPRIVIGGANPGDFTLVTDAPTSILGGGTGTFTLRFNPTATGPRTATVTIANTDLDEAPYVFTIQGTGITPEMNVNQGGTGIASGTGSYDFGDILRSTSSADIAFTIENTGTGVLDLTGSPSRVVIGGANASDFTLVIDASSSIANGATANFQIRFTPSATGVRTATITIDNGDLDENPYTFDIEGTGITPEIDVDQGGTAIANGGTHNFGGFIIGDDSGEITFTITNNGTSPLNLSGTPRIVIGGANPGDFTLNTDASAGPIVNLGSTNFGITFAPTGTGLRTATATITSDDLDESPYVINLNGNGSTPGIDIGQGGAVIANSGSYDFGNIIQSQNSGDIVFFIDNTGTSTLNLTSTPRVIVGGANAGDFSVTTDAPTSVGAGGTVNFEVRFTPTALGVRNATITVANSDLTDNPYVINLTGTSVSPEIGVKQGLTPIASGGTYDFGTVLQSQNGGDIIFGVENTGTSTLNLSGATRVVITGTNAGDFQLITDAPSSVGIAATGNFAIRFAPTGTGARTAVATITSDDLDEGTYTVNLTGNGISPEMDLNQGGTAIASGVDTYDFGDVLQGVNSADIIFTIENNGSATLDMTGATRVNISGAAAGDYSVVADAPTSVLAGNTTTFTIRFNPSTTGTRNATVTINNSDLDENPYTFNLTGNGVVSEIEVAQGATPLLDGAGSYDFGNVLQGQSSGDITFDISNTGTGDLILSGATIVNISGTNAGDFVLVTDASSPIASGGNDSFVIRFTPTGGGLRSAVVTLTNNDLDEGTYTFDLFGTGITPEIAVTQGATLLPTPAGTHNFGNVFQGQSSSDINFTITNSGTGDLLITGANNVNIGGANAGDFVLVTDAASTVASGGGTSNFTIRFTPTTTGLRFATVTINNNDLDEGTYVFNLSGTSITPEINVVQGATTLLNGAGTYNFGNVLQTQNSANVTFTIENTAGTGPLDLTSTPRIVIGGANPGDFTLVTDAPTSILGGGTGTFTLRFNPTATGPRTATVTIANTDLDEAPYVFTIQGTGITPEMNVNQGGTGIASGTGSYDFGDILRSTSSADIAFTIENTGTGVLDLTGSPSRVVIGGANASDFTLVTDAPSSIANGATANFQIRFTPSATGVRTATVTIDNGDLDENPYTFDIEGTGITPEIDVDQGGTAIANGGTHNFGGFIIGDDSGEITFTITNNGTSPLNLSGTPRIVIGGANPGDFTLNTDASAGPIVNLGSTNFGITFAPTGTGLRTATATITSDDLDESPYVINLNGNGSTPGIDIGQGGAVIANSGSYDFGNIIQSQNSGDIVFFIDNTGTSTLNLTSTPRVIVGGANAGDFSVTTDAPTSVGAGGTVNFEVRFTPTALGVRNATITVANSDLTDNPYVINLTGTSVSPEIGVKQGLTPIASGGTYDFGTVLQSQNGGDIIFGVENTGTSTLNLSGATRVVITGTNAGDFQLITDAPSSVGIAATGNFAIRFAPTGTGTRTAMVTITSDDLDEGTYTVNLTGNGISPEMDLNQGGTAIASGVDTYDFGDVLQGENSTDIIFTIENNGSAALDMTGGTRVQISGAAAGDYSVVADAPTSVLAGNTTTFTLRFSPSTAGTRNATVTINNSDLDENPYTFNLTGNGVVSEIEVAQGGTALLDGIGVYNFGNILQGQSSGDITFDISNTGTGDLKLSGVTKVDISGVAASDYTLVTDASSPIASGGSDTFVIRFTPSASGLRSATVTLTTNDLDEGTYTFTLNGTGITPEIVVTQGATNLPTPAGTYNFGNIFQGQSSSDINFTITNSGTGDLLITGANNVNIGGVNAGDFILVTDAPSTIGAGSNAQFTIRFTPTATGLRFATVTINNNDLDEGTYVFNLSGTSITPEINVVQGVTPMPDGAGNYDFGNVFQASSSSDVTFTIENTTGTGTLSLTSTPRIIIGGANASDFTLVTDAPTSIGAGGTGTFTLRFTPSGTSAGVRTATITIANNDLDEGVYDFTIQGTGITPEINVRQGGTNLLSGTGVYDFGNVITGFSSSDVSFDLQNTGTGDLLITGASSINIGGANPGDFTLVTDASSTVGAGTTSNFVIRFTPTAVGARTATVTINNNDLDEGTYTFTLNGTGISPEIDVDQGGTAIANTTSYDFGTILLGLSSPVTTFTITNNGSSNLSLSGAPVVQITGVHAAEYILDFSATATNLAPGASTTFTIQFTPAAGGTRIATVTIPNNDVDESPYIFNLTGVASTEPEVEVVGIVGASRVLIANGDVTPTTADNTDFGNLNVGTDFIDLQFAVRNIGSSPLNLTTNPRVMIGGADASEFTLISDANTPVGPSGGENTFIIRFDPSSTGIKNAQITINNDDTDEGIYTFNIVGRGVEPIIGVRQDATSIANGGIYDYGDVALGNESGELVFTIENTGDDDLNLTGITDKVSITGVNSSEFIFVGAQPSTPIAPAGTQEFRIKFAPVGSPGDGDAIRSATVTIDNDDIDRAPYTFSIQGNGIDLTRPDMVVRRIDNGSRVANGSTIDFGTVAIAQSEQLTFTVTNEGDADLITSDFALNSSIFVVLDPLVATLSPGASDDMIIQYTPGEPINYAATLSFATNDMPVYNLDLVGIGGEALPNIVVTLESDTLASEALIDFNAVKIGEQEIKQFVIANTGESVLFIDDVTLSSTVYTFDFPSTPTTILPGSSDTLNLEFSPTIDEGGRHEGAIVITNSDPDIPSFILNIEGSAATPIIIPNLFSPNGDGVNDNFILHADPEDVANIQLWIYDRYNNIVFESNNVEEITQIGWDGTRNGVALPTDTYFWKVSGTFTDGTKVEFDGQQQGKIRLIVE